MGSEELLGQLFAIRGSSLRWTIIRFKLRKLDRAKCQGYAPVWLNKNLHLSNENLNKISGASDHVYANNLKQVFTHI